MQKLVDDTSTIQTLIFLFHFAITCVHLFYRLPTSAAAFKAGKLPSNPYLNGPGPMGAMLPPPMG